MLKNRLFWATAPLVCYILYDNRKKIYYGYRWIKLWSIIKGVGLLKSCGLWWKEVPKLTPDELFIKKYKYYVEKMETIIKGGVGEDCVYDNTYNKNMLNIYYNKDELNAVILNNRENDHELAWKRRITMINTPYGNVGMYYDLYHRGFSYYSDVKNIPYNILNCISMYYVFMYSCLDFYY